MGAVTDNNIIIVNIVSEIVVGHQSFFCDIMLIIIIDVSIR